MISFSNDYLEGCCEEILDALAKTNREQLPGYGADRYCLSAAEKIRKACDCPDAEVFFANGGTQTNQLVISTVLDQYEGVLAADTGHVSLHEAGAIEYSGHKVLALPSENGKIASGDIQSFIDNFYSDANHEHMVFPGMVYISQPTEYGTVYSSSELADISRVCREAGIPLFIDGARLGYGLAADGCDFDLAMLARLCDVFYIGGTKMGALCGEAIVFPRGNAPKHFVTRVKQHGALSAKGRLYGIQFDTLFTDGLYLRLGRHAVEMAMQVRQLLLDHGFELYIDSPTNQQFAVVSKDFAVELVERVEYGFWENLDDGQVVIRFATSWATTQESVDELAKILDEIC